MKSKFIVLVFILESLVLNGCTGWSYNQPSTSVLNKEQSIFIEDKTPKSVYIARNNS